MSETSATAPQRPANEPPRRQFVNLLLATGPVTSIGAFLYPVLCYLVPLRLPDPGSDPVLAAKASLAMLNRGRGTQTPVPQLKGSEMSASLACLASLRYFEPSASPVAGKQVFAKRDCASFDGDSAEGTLSGPGLRAQREPYTAASFASAVWRHGPRRIDRAEDNYPPAPAGAADLEKI